MDGNADGTQGDNYVRQFKIINNTAPVLTGLNPFVGILRDELPSANPGTLVSQLLTNHVGDPDGPGSGVAIASATSNFGTWQYTLNGVEYADIEPRLTGGPVVGDGTAQRSIVKQIVVTLDREVTIGAGAFIVTKRDGGAVTSSGAGVTNAQGQFVVTITFSGSLTHSGVLNDGYYQLIIDGTKLTRAGQDLDINQDGDGGDNLLIGDEEADNFFALFGDTNGDGLVGAAEFGQFRSAFGKNSGDVGYNILFDFEMDSTVGISDFGQFRARFGKPKLPY